MAQSVIAHRSRRCYVSRQMFALISALSLAVALAGEEGTRPHYAIPKIDSPVVLDGRLDDEAWAGALVLELDYETRPGENTPAPDRTECRLFYSTSHLYYGCHAYDAEPSKIRARYADRDVSFPRDDAIGIALDPFDSENRAFIFDVNPLGVQNDRVFTEASGISDASWDALWSSAGRLVEDGYVVEVEIPFSALRFPKTEETQVWGFNFRRYQPREVFRRVAIMPYDRSDPCRLCQTAELEGFAAVDPGRNLEVTPTLTGVQDSVRSEFPDGALETDDPELDAGLSVRWGITNNLQLSGTLNPDFSQVEADVAQLEVNEQFALFFPELRPFFLEGNDFFRTPLRTVFTRTLADPAWGLKLTGKQGPHAIGSFVVRDEQTNFLIPGFESTDSTTLDQEATSTVARYAHDVGDRSSSVGLVITDRRGDDYANTVGGVDAFLQWSTTDVFEVHYLRSDTEYPLDIANEFAQPLDSFSDDAFSIGYEHAPRNWNVRAQYRDIGDGFRADSGFVPRVGFRQAVVGGAYEWFGDADNWYTNFEVGGDWDRTETQDGFLLEEEYEIGAVFRGQLQSRIALEATSRERTFEGVFFDQEAFELGASFRPTSSLRLGFEVEKGDGIDFEEVRPGDALELEASLGFSIGRHFVGNIFHTREELDVEGGNLFTADLNEIRLVYQFNTRSFVRLITQYAQIERDPSLYADPVEPYTDELFGQFLFSYRLDARTALWAGYTANYLDEFDAGLTETGNSIFFKLSYAWQP